MGYRSGNDSGGGRRGRVLRRGAVVTTVLATVFAAWAWSSALAQDEGLPVQLLLEDGSEAPFVIELHRGETPFVRLHDGERGALATVRVERDGTVEAIPIEEVARIDRVRFMDVRWFVTLRSGEVLEAAVVGDGAFFEIAGTTTDGERVRWNVDLALGGDPPFAAVIFAPELDFPVPGGTVEMR